jgi:eukaryotic-like serine/threonine-protein kinase
MSQASPTVFNGRYELQRRLARGGMADVFLARDRMLDRPVAIKVLFPDLASDPSFVERFRREAQAAANLNHPNIVGIYDWGQQDDTYFIVMEYVDGRSLADVIRTEGKLDADRAADIANDVAAALGSAHRSGVVHRDVKPGNVLITSDGQVKVADFGIATVLSDTNTDLTRAGTVMGTATYFAPEQAQGRPVDARSDLYSLGVVLYEMLVGRPPFKGDTPLAVAIKHVQDQAVPPRNAGANVAESLEAITMKLLAKNPQNRYPSADDLRADLRRYREGMHSLRKAAGGMPTAAAAGTGDPHSALTQVVGAVGGPAGNGADSVRQPTGVVNTTGFYEPPSENRTGMIIAVALLLLLSVGGLIFAFVKVLGNDNSPPATTDIEMPNVVDKDRSDATAILLNSGFATPDVVEVTRDDKTPGTVVSQTPSAGQRVKASVKIVLTVNLGATSDFPPNVVGLNADDAETLIKSRGFTAQRVLQTSTDVPEGQVISQDPQPDKLTQKGKQIIIRVSSGGKDIILPDFSNRPADQVLQQLTALKLNSTTVRETSDTVDAEKVIRTDPPPGKIKEGATVTVVISDGLPKFDMPNVVGAVQAAADAQLTSKGLLVTYDTASLSPDDPNVGKVTKQSIAAGQKVQKGTTVDNNHHDDDLHDIDHDNAAGQHDNDALTISAISAWAR